MHARPLTRQKMELHWFSDYWLSRGGSSWIKKTVWKGGPKELNINWWSPNKTWPVSFYCTINIVNFRFQAEQKYRTKSSTARPTTKNKCGGKKVMPYPENVGHNTYTSHQGFCSQNQHIIELVIVISTYIQLYSAQRSVYCQLPTNYLKQKFVLISWINLTVKRWSWSLLQNWFIIACQPKTISNSSWQVKR